MEGINGWDSLLKLACLDIMDYAENDIVSLRYQLVRKMATYYRVYQVWSKSWPLLRMSIKYKNSSEIESRSAFREQLIPSIKDCLYALQNTTSMSEARRAAINLSELGTPAHIRVSDSQGKLITYREPAVFEPSCDRNKEMTEVIFQCIEDLEIPLRFDTTLIEDYGEKVLTRFLFYFKLYIIFQYEYWSADLCKEFEVNDANLFPVFHHLLQIEIDSSPHKTTIYHWSQQGSSR